MQERTMCDGVCDPGRMTIDVDRWVVFNLNKKREEEEAEEALSKGCRDSRFLRRRGEAFSKSHS